MGADGRWNAAYAPRIRSTLLLLPRGKIEQLREPAGSGIGWIPSFSRVDRSAEYDPRWPNWWRWHRDRMTAIRRMLRALDEYSIVGVETNLAFFIEILNDAQFREGRFGYAFRCRFFSAEEWLPLEPSQEMELVAALAGRGAFG